ncbi:hypothetical protein QQS21_001765 [Conoideocrella luteorostrata]|uniref:Uncharacterized protein n=1 Tax=Conoideocrella luteorostrata TaxID=1105319 RepID=A0AAJ0CWC0_9HYPO|nr:hypothetical protein QQS21_001765 [Conoideocrella luteorostrata]
MGGGASYYKPAPLTKGCWWTRYNEKRLPFVSWAERKWDCDCRLVGSCPSWPPPPPPMQEFIKVDTVDDPGGECARLYQPKNDTTWDPAWGDPTVAWHPYKDYQKPKYAKHDGSPKRSKRFASPLTHSIFDTMDYQESVMQILAWTMRQKRSALTKRFGPGFPFDRDNRNISRTKDDALDAEYKFVFGLLLAEPDMHGQTIISKFSPTGVGTLLHCADFAIRRSLDVIHHHQHAAKRNWAAGSDEQDYLSEEHDYMLILGDRYLQHTSRAKTFHSRAIAAESRMNRTCTTIYNEAVSNFQESIEDRYVSDYSTIVLSLNRQSMDSPLLDAVRSGNVVDELGPKLNWSEANMRNAFGPAFPALAVGFSFLTFALHADALAPLISR